MFDWMHRGRVERPESEFRLEYMAAQKAKEESARHSLQQLKAAIVRSCPECQLPEPTMCDCFNCFAEKLQRTTAAV